MRPRIEQPFQGVAEFRNGSSVKGPLTLFIAWALHDVEEAVAFPGTCDRLAERSGIDGLRMDSRQSWAAVGLMGVFVAVACWRGARKQGESRLYRFVVAGLEAHVGIHLAASAIQRRYTAGVVTALPVMLPAAVIARKELMRAGVPLRMRDYAAGAVILIPAALVCHLLARAIPLQRR